MLSEKQFKLLRFLLIHKDENFTQRQLAEQLDLSLGTVNALVLKRSCLVHLSDVPHQSTSLL